MELPRDAETIAGDEDTVVDDGTALRVGGDAVRAEAGSARRAAELSGRPRGQRLRGHGLASGGDLDAGLEGEDVAERGRGPIPLCCPFVHGPARAGNTAS